MQITKKAIESIKKESDNKLTKEICDVLLEKGTGSDIKSYINDLMYDGCASGMEGSLIYYDDTINFYNKHKSEINNLLKEMLDETGLTSPAELFGDKWEKEDIFAEEVSNQNLLAWFGFEETVRKIAYELNMDI